MKEWLPKLRQLNETAALTWVYFNNHFRGQAAWGARNLRQLFAQE